MLARSEAPTKEHDPPQHARQKELAEEQRKRLERKKEEKRKAEEVSNPGYDAIDREWRLVVGNVGVT